MFTPQQEERIKELIREVLHEQTTNKLDEITLKFFDLDQLFHQNPLRKSPLYFAELLWKF